MYREMDMPFWLEQADEEMREVGVRIGGGREQRGLGR